LGGLASVGLEQGKRASTCRPRDAGSRWNNFYLNNFRGYSLILAGRWNPIIRISIARDVEYLRCIIAVWKMTLDLRCLMAIEWRYYNSNIQYSWNCYFFDYSLFYGHIYGNARLLGVVRT
jgi:hypothetical protein